MAKGPYDDGELSPEEQRLISEADRSTDLPPDDSQDGPPVVDEPAPAPAAEAPKPADAPAAEAPAAEEPKPGQSEDEAYAAFLAKHAGKSADELAKIAFQQQARANREAAQGRVAGQQLQALSDRVKQAMTRKQEALTAAEQRKTGFREKLSTDPDAATAEINDRLVDAELAAHDEEIDRAQLAEAVGFASTAFPDFEQRWPDMKALGIELNYSPAELSGIRDGRDFVTLGLATLSAKLLKAGIIDTHGNLLAQPQATTAPTDPRLTAPAAITTVGSGGGGSRASDGAKSTESQLADILSLSDTDFDKMDPAVLNNLLQNAG